MLKLNFTNNAKQRQVITTEDGETFTFEVEYRPIQQCFIYNFNYKNKVVINGKRLCFNDNILSAYQNILPFGIRVVASDVNDFVEIWNWSNQNGLITSDLTNGRVLIGLLKSSEL